jgi:outer membrane protein
MISDPTRSRTRRSRGWLAVSAVAMLLVLPAAPGAAQGPVTMTLEEAISLARQNNPTYRQTANDESLADWNVRQAYGNFIPSLSLNSSMSYTASGTPRFGIFSGAELGLSRSPAYYSSSYSISMNLGLSGATIFRAIEAKANQGATEKRVAAADYQLTTDVTRQYLAALRAQDGVSIARSALESTQEALRLAQARAIAGDATRIDASQAEVDRGRAEVLFLQAENLARTERLRLLQTIGIELAEDIELTSTFEVFEPRYELEQLQAIAGTSNPVLAAARADEKAAVAASRSARTAYLPSVNLNAGWSGFIRRADSDQYVVDQALGSAQQQAENSIENCQFMNSLNSRLTSPLPGYPADCSAEYALTPERISEIQSAVVSENNRFPFDYDPNPFSASLSVSIPIVDGFTRERNVHQARVAAEDAGHRRRAEELNRRAEVTTNLLALETAWRTVALEEKNSATAAEQLELAQQRYRLGAGSILELTQAQETKVRADFAQLDAMYAFHETLAALEAAVGIPLREMTNAAGELEFFESQER